MHRFIKKCPTHSREVINKTLQSVSHNLQKAQKRANLNFFFFLFIVAHNSCFAHCFCAGPAINSLVLTLKQVYKSFDGTTSLLFKTENPSTSDESEDSMLSNWLISDGGDWLMMGWTQE